MGALRADAPLSVNLSTVAPGVHETFEVGSSNDGRLTTFLSRQRTGSPGYHLIKDQNIALAKSCE